MYTQYNTKGKVTGKIGGGVMDETALASAVDIQEMKISITNMQNAVSNAANAANKVKEMQVKLNDFMNEQPKVWTNKDSSNSATDVYSTGYVNRELAKIPIITTTNDISGNVSAGAVPTVRAIQSIENIGNIPSVMSEYAESNTDTYSTVYMNDLASKIPTPMDVNGISDDINPIVYTANYIDNQLPLICSNYDSIQNSQNVYNTEYVNREFDGVRNEMSAGLDGLRSSITEETSEKIASAVSELHDTVTGETDEKISTANSALHATITVETSTGISNANNELYSTITAETSNVISTATSALHTTISTETSTAISTAISQHETSESPLELKRAKITISPATQETSETVPKFIDNQLRTINNADICFCGRIMQGRYYQNPMLMGEDSTTMILSGYPSASKLTEYNNNRFQGYQIDFVQYNDGSSGMRVSAPTTASNGLAETTVMVDTAGNNNAIAINNNTIIYTDLNSIIAQLVIDNQCMREKIAQLESALATLQAKHDGSEEII